ncbi:T-complex protein 1 subunit eta [Platysternon megacephalum]|uniref:E3 SUMO-protein ligase NSE2 n=1 Tax=Platysternon megacephalum TaxID=55544 RepID=A0A4D9EF21_9SAUR|nr:T-complex protein 1 subunit eta [Platysternon megacephalum]
MYTPTDRRVALEPLKECSIEGQILNGLLDIGALSKFWSQDALPFVTTEATTLIEVSISSADCKDVLAIKQPSGTNAENSSHEASGSWSANFDIAVQLTKSYLDSKTFGPRSDTDANESIEQIDEDIAVTQSQMNFICPITQMEMQKPVRNKVCGHTYEEAAILKIIQRRENQRKKACCPKIGCSHLDVKRSDLVPDEALKRAIDSQNKQARSMP